MMKIILLEVLFCLLLLVTLHLSSSYKNDRLYFGTRIQLSNDHYSAFYIFDWMIKASINMCVDGCKSTKVCQYINYEVRTRNCALIRTDGRRNNSTAALVEVKPGYIFGNKSEWISNTSNKCDACAKYGMCETGNLTVNNYSLCRNSGCGIPGDDDYLGNMFSLGSSILQKCEGGSQAGKFNCVENGTWSVDQLTDCPQSYFKGSYYYLQSIHMTWHEAEAYCESISGHLVDIETEQEHLFLHGLIHAVGNDTVFTWSGGNDLANEGDFRWSDGFEISNYTNWRPKEPDNNNGKQHCIGLVTRVYKTRWVDTKCKHYLQSICESNKKLRP